MKAILKNKNIIQSLIVSSAVMISTGAIAEEIVSELNGYTRVVIKPTLIQKEHLKQVISINVPPVVRNNGQLLNLILQKSGYKIADPKNQPKETLGLFVSKIPLSLMSLRSITIEQAIESVLGFGFYYKVDHVKREITIFSNK